MGSVQAIWFSAVTTIVLAYEGYFLTGACLLLLWSFIRVTEDYS